MDYNTIISEMEEVILKDNNPLSKWSYNYLNLQKNRYQKDIQYIRKLSNIDKVLDVGAAPFHLSAIQTYEDYTVDILDIDPMRFAEFISYYNLNVEKCNIEIDNLPCEENSYDLVWFTEVFEHLRINPIETLYKIQRTIKPGGLLYLTTPNFYRYTNIFSLIKGKGFVNAFEEFNKINLLGHMGHVREYTKKEVEQFLIHAGLEIIDFQYKGNKKLKKYSQQYIMTSLFNTTKSHMMFLAKKRKI